MASSIIALDVGGTSIKAALVTNRGELIESSVMDYPSMAKEAREVIIGHLLDIIRQQAESEAQSEPESESKPDSVPQSRSIDGIALAFPGPFDYDRGISLMQGIDKFDSIYGVNLEMELRQRISGDSSLSSRFAEGWRIVFENDVCAFALGQLEDGRVSAYDKCLCLTIGTGLGSAFLKQGSIVTEGEDIPPNGWLYNQPFRDGILDDYLSRRGILRIAEQLGRLPENADVKELADRARGGDRTACEVFARFGTLLAAALEPYFESFRPDAVILGGQIAKSFDLSVEAFRRGSARAVEIVTVDDTSDSAILGAASLLMGQG